MSTVQDHLKAGDLNQAIALMNDEVRKNPADIDRRGRLAELLCLAGNIDRADTILDSIVSLDAAAAVGVALFRQLVRAEQARQQFYSDGRLPEFLKRPDGAMELELRAAVALRAGDLKETAKLLAEAEAARPVIRGTADGKPFEDFRDLDDLNASHLEVLTSTGKYYWIPVASIRSIEFRPPVNRRDLLWRRAAMSVADGPDGEVFVPAIYAARGQELEPRYRLGHATSFTGDDDGPKFGLGLKSFLVGDDSRTIHELGTLEFPQAAGAA